MDKPIPLITVNKDGKFVVEKAALDFLRKVDGKIGVVTVAGLYRTGKSYILNRLLNRQSGFEIGATVNSQTKGIYVWGTPLEVIHQNGEKMKIILVDTEGIGSVEKDETYDSKIFALAILLSSFFIYNSFGVIDESALDKLSFITQMSHHIQSKSGDRSEIFPAFMWLLRDFTLDLVDLNGKPITSQQYLENALASVPDKAGTDRNKTKNEIRKTITQFFRERDCVTLVRPTVDEKDLRFVDKIPYESLRPAFRKQVETLRTHVLAATEFKTLMGRRITAEEFGIMCSTYVKAINEGAVPDLKSAWENIGMIENPRAAEEAYKTYQAKMKASCEKTGYPMIIETLSALHRKTSDDALQFFQSKKIGEDVEKYIKELKERMEAEYTNHVNLNNAKASQISKSTFDSLAKKVDEKVEAHAYKDITDLMHDLNQLQSGYINTTKSLNISPAFAHSEFFSLAPQFWNSVLTRTTKYILRDQELKFTKLQQQLTELQTRYDSVRTEKETAQLEKVKLEAAKTQLERDVSTMKANIHDLQQKITQLLSEKSQLDAEIKKVNEDRVATSSRMQSELSAQQMAMKEFKTQAKQDTQRMASSHDQIQKDLEIRLAKLGDEKKATQAEHALQISKLQAEKEAVQHSMEERVSKMEQEKDVNSRQYRKERKSIGADLIKEKSEKEAAESRLNKISSDKDTLAQEIAALRVEKEGAQKKVTEMQNQVGKAMKEAVSIREEMENKLKAMRKTLDDNVEASKRNLEEKESVAKKARKNETDMMQNKLDVAESAKKMLQIQVRTWEEKGTTMEKEVTELRQRLVESESNAKKMQSAQDSDYNNTRKEIQEASQRMKQLTQDTEERIEELRREVEGKTREVEGKAREVEEKTKQSKKLQKQLDNLTAKQEEDRRMMDVKWEEERRESDVKLRQSQATQADQLRVSQSGKDNLQNQITELGKARLVIQKENEDLRMEVDRLKKAVEGGAGKKQKTNGINSSNNNNNESTQQVDDPEELTSAQSVEKKKRKVSTPFTQGTPKRVKLESSKEVEAPKQENPQVDPSSLTIPQLKRQLTQWDVTLPAQAVKKNIYVDLFRNHLVHHPDAEIILE